MTKEFKIEKDIPFDRSRPTEYDDLIKDMDIGNSVVVTPKGALRLQRALKKAGFVGATSLIGEGRTRVWKFEKGKTNAAN